MTRLSDIRRAGRCTDCGTNGIYAAQRCRRCYATADVTISCSRCGVQSRTTPGRLRLCGNCHDLQPQLLSRWLDNRRSVRNGQLPTWFFTAATDWVAISHSKQVIRHLLHVERLILAGVCTPGELLATLNSEPETRRTAAILGDFFTRHGVPADGPDATVDAWRQGRLDRLPARLQPAGQQFVNYLVGQQRRTLLCGGASLSDKTIAYRINVLLQLADHLDTRGVDDWAAVTAEDLEVFLTVNTAQRIPALRAFFAFTRRRKITLINLAAHLRRSQRKGYAGPLIDHTLQRQLLCRWRRDDTDPRERVVGLLCLIHAASNEDVRMLSLDDIDLDRATVRLRNRRHPVPLDPLTVDAIRACLQQRPTTAVDNRFLLVTHHSRQHNRPCSIGFPVRALTKVGLTPQVLRQTRLSDLAQRADPRMMAEAIGITKEAAVHYIIGNVHRAEDAFPGTGDQTRQEHDGE
jgi:site-specific recombinase XerD